MRHDWVTSIASIVIIAVLLVGGVLAWQSLRDDNTELRNHLRLVEQQERDSRYLLCRIGDAVSIDALPQPCLVNGHPVKP